MPPLPRILRRSTPTRLAPKLAHTIADEDPSRPLWRHPVAIAAAALALTLGAVPFLPDGDDDQGSIAPSSETTEAPAGAIGRGRVTAAMQAEIDRVLAEGTGLERVQGRTALARASVRCATFDGQRY
ncbi:MAG TPA: hypothetical protein VGD39_16100, partial [Nocardioides sp.]